MLAYVITAVVAFLAGHLSHVAITEFMKRAELKAETAAKSVVADAEQVAKKL